MTARVSITTAALALFILGCNGERDPDTQTSTAPSAHTSPNPHSSPTSSGTSPDSAAVTQQSTPQPMNPSSAADAVSVEVLKQAPPEYGTVVQVRGLVRTADLNQALFSGVQQRVVYLYGPPKTADDLLNPDLRCELEANPTEAFGCGDEITIEGKADPDWIGGLLIYDAAVVEVNVQPGTTPAAPASADFAADIAEINDLTAQIEAHAAETGLQTLYFYGDKPGPYRVFVLGNAIAEDGEFIRGIVEQVSDNPIISEACLTGPFTTEEVALISSMQSLQMVTMNDNPQMNSVDISTLAELPHLSELSIARCEALNDAFGAQFAAFDHLYQLNLGYVPQGVNLLPNGQALDMTAEGFGAVASLLQLRHLTIETNTLSFDSQSVISDEARSLLEAMTNLKELRLSGTP